jgi:putative ABC transport system permease protein
MIKRNLKIVYRNFIKNKAYFLINIGGFSLGITCVIAIFLWIGYEKSYNASNKDAKQLYHVYLKSTSGTNEDYQITCSPFIAKSLKDNIPEIDNIVRYGFVGRNVLKRGEYKFIETEGIGAEQSLFDILSINFIYGEKENALNNNQSIVLTQSLAEKYFGNENPIGKSLTIENKYEFTVSAVIDDIPNNSSNTFDYIIPYKLLGQLGNQVESNEPFYPCDFVTIVKLQKETSLNQINKKIAGLFSFSGGDRQFNYCLIPLLEVHNLETGINKRIVLFLFIGFFILCLACINFINLSIAMSFKRVREIGIRKINGAFRRTIISQFISENFILIILSVAIAVVCSTFLIKYYNNLTNSNIEAHFFNLYFVLVLLGIIIITGLIAGLYPALYQSALLPVKALKGNQGNNIGKVRFRKPLIIFQFIISIVFIICAIGIKKQSNFILNFNPGFTKSNILYVNLEGELREKYPIIKEQLLQNPGIENITTASQMPDKIYDGNYSNWGINDNVNRRFSETTVDYEYLKTFGMQMKEGRFYSKDFPSDLQNSIIVNEAALKELEVENYVGKLFLYNNEQFTLIGVMKDFHHKSAIHHAPEPVIFRLQPEDNGYMFIKIRNSKQSNLVSATVREIKEICEKYSTDYPFQYGFLGDNPVTDELMLISSNKLISRVSIIAIIVSCLGLFGLSIFLNNQRTKEIGVRKVNGAKISEILFLLNKDFIILIITAFFIACPLAFFAINKWLEDFACKTELSWWIYALAGLFALGIALLTVSLQTWRAATRNPMEALRYE